MKKLLFFIMLTIPLFGQNGYGLNYGGSYGDYTYIPTASLSSHTSHIGDNGINNQYGLSLGKSGISTNLAPETVAFTQRVLADGGTIGDLYYLNQSIIKAKQDNTLTSTRLWYSPAFGYKADVNNYVSKFYNVGYKESATELITNGTFDNETGWSLGANVTIGSGVATYATGSGFPGLSQTVTITAGKKYKLSYTIVTYTSGRLYLTPGGSGTSVTLAGASTGAFSETILWDGVNNTFYLRGDAASFIGAIDNLSFKEILNPDLIQLTAASQPLLGGYVQNNPQYGNELVTNGNFTDSTGWSKSSSQWDFVGGTANYNHSVGGYISTTLTAPIVAGKQYRVSYKITTAVIARWLLANQDATGNPFVAGYTNSPSGTYANVYTALYSATGIRIYGNVDESNFSFDDISIKEALPEPNKLQCTSDGSNDFMKTSLMALVQPTTVYWVGKQVSWTSGRYFFDGYDESNRIASFQTNASPIFNSFAGSAVSENNGLAINSFGVVTWLFNGASGYNRVNNNSVVTGNSGAGNGNGITVGARCTNVNPGNISFTEIRVLDAVMTTAQDNSIKNQINLFWKIY